MRWFYCGTDRPPRDISSTMRWLFVAAALVVPRAGSAETLDPRRFEVIERESGATSYYTLLHEDGRSFVRAVYRPPLETVVVGIELTDDEKRHARRLRWSWRALAMPAGADPCTPGKGDAAAAVYVSWKRGMRWYTLKYVWSDGSPAGTSCRRRRSPFAAQATVVLASGAALHAWRSEEIDLPAAFREHFGGEPPDYMAVAIMTDGDQTGSVSAADYADFALLR
jgi:hypothetical protein